MLSVHDSHARVYWLTSDAELTWDSMQQSQWENHSSVSKKRT